MAIKASFPNGKDSITVNGLYQWDHDQILEIEAADLPLVVEVHFAYRGLNEAIVRPCSTNGYGGIGTVTIPNLCLEQTNPVTAWIYEKDGTLGRTIKTITLPIIARARPGAHTTDPDEPVDKYTELIAEVNEAAQSIRDGNVTVQRAKKADEAIHAAGATEAGIANKANTAQKADFATSAESATYASKLLYENFASHKTLTYGRNIISSAYVGSGQGAEIPHGETPEFINYLDLSNKLVVLDIECHIGDRFVGRRRTLPFTTASSSTDNNAYELDFLGAKLKFVTYPNGLYGCASVGGSTQLKFEIKAIYEEL